MDTQTATLIALGIAALLVLAFFAVFRYRGKFSIKTKLGEVTAEGENTPPTAVQETQSPIHEGSSQKLGFGSAGISQVGTGSSVIVAQSGANVIVQTGERSAPLGQGLFTKARRFSRLSCTGSLLKRRGNSFALAE